ncbi:hypothetical protein TrCOL_g7397 [Triparma columacea]|uniref:Lsm14-like N-terminal domain-containing protein n=1 Tax=Triparma columacea TaxID=722753 RepID=A0A9W7FUE0_9STRA|nr:hypothetical protein TrCOL_g7397 [Triparma columacea]
MSNPLLGNKISLISKKDIRYSGILYTINEVDHTVALKDVRSFGTEDRCSTVIPPSSEVHEYLLFRGCDIKDLHVHDQQEAAMEKPKPPEDPAILSTKMPPPAPSPAPAPAPAPAAAKKEKKKEVVGENSGPMVYDNFKAPSENKSTNNADRHNNDTFNEGYPTGVNNNRGVTTTK